MSIKNKDKGSIISKFAKSENDTGSCEVQVALISQRIRQISGHLKLFPKDKHSTLGLIKLVEQRRSFLSYIKKKNASGYASFVNSLKEIPCL